MTIVRPPAEYRWEGLIQHFDRAQRLSNAGSWEWDMVTDVIVWSAHIYRIFGLRPYEFQPTYPAFLARVHPDDRDLVEGRVQRAIEGIEPYDIEHRIVLPDGAIRLVREIGEVEYAEDGRPLKMLGAVQDITELRVIETASRRNAEMLATMLRLSPEAVIVTDEAGRILQFSAGAEAMYGYRAVEALGLGIDQLIPEPFRIEYQRMVEGCLAGEVNSIRMHERTPIYGLRKGGERFPAEASIAMTGDGFTITAIVRDLTELQAAEARLNEARIKAENANQAKSNFLANMSHEIRTPLNGVLGVASALARSVLSARQQKMVALIEKSGRALDGLLSDILDISSIDQGRTKLRVEPFDLGASVDEVVALFSASAAQKGVGLSLEIDDPARACYQGDDLRIRQILSNLLSNAVKFTESGQIAVAVSTMDRDDDRRRVRFTVQDTGIGFGPDDTRQLFERFEQADRSITRPFGGTGLGLSICRSLTELMGGWISADSTPGQGSRFTFDLPLRPVFAEARPEPDAEGGLQAQDVRGRILMAEDHQINQLTVQMILEDLPVDVVCVENGEQAVDAAGRDDWDLILMDMQMPVMDGLTAIRLIREHEASAGRRRRPICVVTANAFPEHRAASDAAGADHFLPKPITASALVALVREHLGRRE